MQVRTAIALALLLALVPATPASAWQPKPKAHAKARRQAVEVPVMVTDAWIREAPPGATAMAGYMLVFNPTKHTLALTHVTSPAFEEVQMHVSLVEDGLSKMKEVPGFTIPPGGRLLFKPGGNHLMLLNPKRPLKTGDIVPLVLSFGPGGKAGHRSLQVKVLTQGITDDEPPPHP
jgi:periplasmic copper chaperone A